MAQVKNSAEQQIKFAPAQRKLKLTEKMQDGPNAKSDPKVEGTPLQAAKQCFT
jgi:hypothetical protein